MEIVKITPQGFCKGVIRAIAIINKALENPNIKRPIYMLGGLVHNKHIINAYKNKGIIIIDSIDNIHNGTIIITAHGISKKIIKEIKDRGLDIINATCFDVLKTHDLIQKKLDEGYDIILYGKSKHPETKGILGISDKINLIESINDIDNLNINNLKLAFATQTTMGYSDVLKIIEKLKLKYPHIETYEEVCTATKLRQNALIETVDADLYIIVGDPTSNNTNKLREICEKMNRKTVMIENTLDLKNINFEGINKVAITAGASTPPAIVNEIIDAIKTKDFNTKLTDHDYLNYRT
ncbi:MAG TPA: 4-hydroxy-3-methylbut-2-enyl diphosphate reductase [Acholeplasmataceae bacterium]|nr:4-hydroxy-3-methylbut-2-enyl diphosphate reductase [Acholeplasmataceae bacterium]